MKKEIENGTISGVRLGYEDRGIFTSMIEVKTGDCRFQGLPSYHFGTYEKAKIMGETSGYGLEVIMHIMKTVGVNEWSKLQGKNIRVVREDGMITGIGHITENRWFDFKSYGQQYDTMLETKKAILAAGPEGYA